MVILDFEKEIWHLLRSINENMELTMKPIIDKYGLTILQARILLEIKRHGEINVGSLANMIGLTSGNTSSVCKKLDETDFLHRVRDKGDERIVNIKLTEYGESTVHELKKQLQKKYKYVFESQTEDDFKEIIYGLEKLASIFKEMNEKNFKEVSRHEGRKKS